MIVVGNQSQNNKKTTTLRWLLRPDFGWVVRLISPDVMWILFICHLGPFSFSFDIWKARKISSNWLVSRIAELSLRELVGLNRRSYLVDPASSHMLVSNIIFRDNTVQSGLATKLCCIYRLWSQSWLYNADSRTFCNILKFRERIDKDIWNWRANSLAAKYPDLIRS